jgi:hypothetical protein
VDNLSIPNHIRVRSTSARFIQSHISFDSTNIHGLVADQFVFGRLVVDTSLNELFDHLDMFLAPVTRMNRCEQDSKLPSMARSLTSLPWRLRVVYCGTKVNRLMLCKFEGALHSHLSRKDAVRAPERVHLGCMRVCDATQLFPLVRIRVQHERCSTQEHGQMGLQVTKPDKLTFALHRHPQQSHLQAIQRRLLAPKPHFPLPSSPSDISSLQRRARID